MNDEFCNDGVTILFRTFFAFERCGKREGEREWRVPLYVNRFKKCRILEEHVLAQCTFEQN